MNETGEPLSEQVKTNLLNWLDKYQDRGEIFFDFPYTPCFGQYEPNLLFINDLVTDENDPAGKPDPHYYHAAGQEVPPQDQERQLAPIWGYLLGIVFLGGSVVGLWAFLGYLFPLIVRCYLGNGMGC